MQSFLKKEKEEKEMKITKRSSKSLKLDRAKRSKQNWERGRGAKRKAIHDINQSCVMEEKCMF